MPVGTTVIRRPAMIVNAPSLIIKKPAEYVTDNYSAVRDAKNPVYNQAAVDAVQSVKNTPNADGTGIVKSGNIPGNTPPKNNMPIVLLFGAALLYLFNR